MEILKEKYSITELSEILNMTDHALRFYEKEFDLAVPKDSRGRRYYPTDLANTMFHIKSMRNDGLEIKAIKKIIQSDLEMKKLPPTNTDSPVFDLVPANSLSTDFSEIRTFFFEFKDQLKSEFSMELLSSQEHLIKEITKTKLELGACVENGMRKLESRMEKHFIEVDNAIGIWRKRKKKNIFRRIFGKT